jgi:hypothetical protein
MARIDFAGEIAQFLRRGIAADSGVKERAAVSPFPRPKKLPHRNQLLDSASVGHSIALHPATLIGFLVGIADVVFGKHRKVAPSLGKLGVDLGRGAKDILGCLFGPELGDRFHSAFLVGIGSDDSHLHIELVGGLLQWLVLTATFYPATRDRRSIEGTTARISA